MSEEPILLQAKMLVKEDELKEKFDPKTMASVPHNFKEIIEKNKK